MAKTGQPKNLNWIPLSILFKKCNEKSPLGLTPFIEKRFECFQKVRCTLKNDSIDISINGVSPNGLFFIERFERTTLYWVKFVCEMGIFE